MKKVLIYTLLILAILEVCARFMYHPFKFQEGNARQEKEIIDELKSNGEFVFYNKNLSKDTVERIVNNGVVYEATYLADKTRYTGENHSNRKIEIFGCSYCFGVGLKDNQTLGYKLQSDFTNYKVKNNCIISAGIPIIYAKFLEQISDSTVAVIFNYSNFQQERIAYSRWLSKILANSSTKNTFKVLKETMLVPDIIEDSIVYRHIKPIKLGLVRYSALANYVDDKSIEMSQRFTDHSKETASILLKMQEACESKGIVFVVNNADGHQYTAKHFKLFEEKGINLLDLNIDIGEENYKLSTANYPNEIANEELAKGLSEYLNSRLN